jgi:hypothetical protein
MPLRSITGTERDDLRPDKLAVMVTNIESHRDLENSWPAASSPSDSEEMLTLQHPPLPGKIEVGVHQTFEVTRTTADGDYGEGSHRTAREHV